MRFKFVLAGYGLALLAGCNLFKDPVPPTQPPTPTPTTYTVGGNATGLSGTLVLANNGSDTRTLAAAGAFTFATRLATGAAYNVTISAQPANQTCVVANGTGTVNAANVGNISVNCTSWRVTTSIGAAGGTLTHPDGATLVVPAGAVSQPTTFTIGRPQSGWPTPLVPGTQVTGSVYEFTPHDVVFSKPVLIRLPYTRSNVPVAFVSSFGEDWATVDPMRNGDFIEYERHTLSWHYAYASDCAGANLALDPYACRFPIGYAYFTATPANVLLMTSGGRTTSLGGEGSVTGSAATWSIEVDQITSLRLVVEYKAAPDCTNGRIEVRRLMPGPSSELLFETPVQLVNGEGSRGIDIPTTLLTGANQSIYYRFACRRPGQGESGGSEWHVLNLQADPVGGFSVGGSVSNLSASGLELRNGNREVLQVPAGATSFTFLTPVIPGTPFDVRVKTQPNGSTCSVANGKGTVSTASVTSIVVTCTPSNVTYAGFAVVASTNAAVVNLFGRLGSSLSGAPLDTRLSGAGPVAVAVAPNNSFAYVANKAGNSISSFRIDAATNLLQPISGGSPAAAGATALAIDAESSYLFVANQGGGGSAASLSMFALDGVTGAPVLADNEPTGGMPVAVARIERSAYTANASDGSISMFRYSPTNGTLTVAGTLPLAVPSPKALVALPLETFLYGLGGTGNITRMAVDATTGALTILGTTAGTGMSCESMVPSADSFFLYLACTGPAGSTVRTYSVDFNGDLTAGPVTTLANPAMARLALSGNGGVLHVAQPAANLITSYAINRGTGVLTESGSVATVSPPDAIGSTR